MMKKFGLGGGGKNAVPAKQQKPDEKQQLPAKQQFPAKQPLQTKQPEEIAALQQQLAPEPWQVMPARTTAIDNVLRDILSSGEPISISDLSKKYGVPKELMAEWADILEHKGFIRVDYSAGGASKASAPKPAKAAREKSPERRNPSKRPTVVIATVLIAVIALFAAQAMNVFRPAQAFNSSAMEFSPNIDISQRPAASMAETFEFASESATYTARSEYLGGGADEHKVYLDKGKARVEFEAYSLLFDGMNYTLMHNDATTDAIDKAFFDNQTARIMPWTYIAMAKAGFVAGATEIVDGKACRVYALQNADSVCMLEDRGFPLKFTTSDFTVLFMAVNLNPDNMPGFTPQ